MVSSRKTDRFPIAWGNCLPPLFPLPQIASSLVVRSSGYVAQEQNRLEKRNLPRNRFLDNRENKPAMASLRSATISRDRFPHSLDFFFFSFTFSSCVCARVCVCNYARIRNRKRVTILIDKLIASASDERTNIDQRGIISLHKPSDRLPDAGSKLF